jgi:hypothetical protein
MECLIILIRIRHHPMDNIFSPNSIMISISILASGTTLQIRPVNQGHQA